MANFKNIWKNTFLGKLLSSDSMMGRVVLILLGIYACIHIFKLEMYPFYLFAMYSKKEAPKEYYSVYKVYNNDQEVKLDNWDYRKYTVFMNTIKQYDDILTNNMVHPEANAIQKFTDRLHLENTSFNTTLENRFTISKVDLEPKLTTWISNALEMETQDLRIEKHSYQWNNQSPQLQKKTIIYGDD